MAIRRVSNQLLGMEQFKSAAPVCGSTIENWIRKSPERLPPMITIGIRRYFKREDAERWFRDNFAEGWDKD